MAGKQTDLLLLDLQERIKGLEREAELFRMILIVKEPNTVQAAASYDGLRKQIVAAAAERRSHLAQLVAMSVAAQRATSVADLVPQVSEWMEQAGVIQLTTIPSDASARDLFEDLTGEGLDGAIEVVEPAYVDGQTGALLRTGRARRAATRTVVRPAPAPAYSPQSAEYPATASSASPASSEFPASVEGTGPDEDVIA